MEFQKSERNQQISDQHKVERKLDLPYAQVTDAERAIIRAQRQERLVGVTFYIRDVLRNHGKAIIPEIIDCA